jgi:hypothetical protein
MDKIRRTDGSAIGDSPARSPNGRHFAFLLESNGGDIFVVGRLG